MWWILLARKVTRDGWVTKSRLYIGFIYILRHSTTMHLLEPNCNTQSYTRTSIYKPITANHTPTHSYKPVNENHNTHTSVNLLGHQSVISSIRVGVFRSISFPRHWTVTMQLTFQPITNLGPYSFFLTHTVGAQWHTSARTSRPLKRTRNPKPVPISMAPPT